MEKQSANEQELLLTILLMDLVDQDLLSSEEAALAKRVYLQENDGKAEENHGFRENSCRIRKGV